MELVFPMSIFSLDELAASVGTRTGNYLKDTANAAANFTCSLYKNYPAAIISNPLDSYVRGLWDTLCNGRPAGLPTPPAVPFIGGQCQAFYNLIARWTWSNPDYPAGYYNLQLWGPLGGIRSRVAGRTEYLEVLCHGTESSGFRPTAYWQGFYEQGNYPSEQFRNPRIDVQGRVDGAPDNCGDPPAKYDGPTSIPSGQDRTTTTYTYNDGTNVSVPLVYAPITGKIGFNIGALNFNFDFGGLNGSNPNADILADLADIENAIADMQSNIDGIIADMHNSPDADMPDDGTQTSDKDVSDLEGLAYVRCIVTTVPPWGDMQYGDGGPNVIYAGWLEFKRDDDYFPRQSIDFADMVFKAPQGANGYAYTLKNGYVGYTIAVQYTGDTNNG